MTGRAVTIGLDARKIRDYGIGRYLVGLLRGLARLPGPERYVLFRSAGPPDLPGDLADALDPQRFRSVSLPAPLYSLRELVAFRGARTRFGLDLLHFPHYVRGFAPGCPVAITIHDAIHLTHPPSMGARLYANAMMKWAARTAHLLFTVSEAARADLSVRLGVEPDRFLVTPNGVGPEFSPPAPDAVEAFRRRRNLADPFVLCVASHRPHKNLLGGIIASGLAGLPDGSLVVPARDPDAARRVARLAAGRRTPRILREVSDEELPLLYAAARIVLAPSLAEGFGLVPLEAAAAGAAVLATGIPAHREVLGDAAAFAHREPPDLARELSALWRDDERRRDLARRGPEHAARFPWERTARQTLEGYRKSAGA